MSKPNFWVRMTRLLIALVVVLGSLVGFVAVAGPAGAGVPPPFTSITGYYMPAAALLPNGHPIILTWNSTYPGLPRLLPLSWSESSGTNSWEPVEQDEQGPSLSDPGVTSQQDLPDISVSYNRQNMPEVFVVTTAGQVVHSYTFNMYFTLPLTSASTVWSSFDSMGAPPRGVGGDVAAGRNSLGNEEIFVVDKDGNLFHNYATPGIGSGWHGWDQMDIPPAGLQGDIHVSTNSLGNQELYAVDSNNTLWHRFATPGTGTGWSAWTPMSSLPGVASFDSDITVSLNASGNQEIYALGDNGTVYHTYATPGHGDGWSGFSSMGSPNGLDYDSDRGIEVFPFDYRVIGNQSLFVWNSADSTRFFKNQTLGQGSGWTTWAAG